MARRHTYNYNVKHGKKGKRGWKRFLDILLILAAVLLVICAYAGKIDPQRFFPAPFLTLAYMPMLVMSAVLLLLAIVCRRWLSAVLLLVAAVATLPIFSLYVPFNSEDSLPPEPVDASQQLKVMTYNVLAFNYNDPAPVGTPSTSIKVILDADPDVVLMQEGMAAGLVWSEIPSVQPYVSQVKAKYPYTYNSPEGLDILSKYPFTTCALSEPRHTHSALGYNRENKAYLARAYDLQLPSGKQLRLIDFRLQSYHLSFGKNQKIRVSPDVKPSPLERMKRSFILRGKDAATIRQAIDASPANVILCGDMNDVTTSNVYRVIKGDDMTDAWAEVGNGYAYTFNRHHLPFRIDHVLYRGKLQALNAKRIKDGSSDHYPLVVSFDIGVGEYKDAPSEN